MLVYPAPREVVFQSGYDTLKDYRFGKKQFDHKFCPDCGSSILIDFHNPERWAVNVCNSQFAHVLVNKDTDELEGSYDQRHRFGEIEYENF